MLSIALAVMRSRPISSEQSNDRIIATDVGQFSLPFPDMLFLSLMILY
jgi:hypothetical protein